MFEMPHKLLMTKGHEVFNVLPPMAVRDSV